RLRPRGRDTSRVRRPRSRLLPAVGVDGAAADVARRHRAGLGRTALRLRRTCRARPVTDRSRVLVSLRVRATPTRAFSAFTEEIGRWWRPNGLFQFTSG